MLDFLKRNKTTELDKIVEKEAYLKEKIKQAEIIGKTKAEVEAKEEIKEIKTKPSKTKTKSKFAKFQDYCDNFVKQPPVIGDMRLNYGGVNGKTKKGSKRSRAGIGTGFFRV